VVTVIPRWCKHDIESSSDLSRSRLADLSPPQEATRIHTPPVREAVADGRPRGLFFDVNQSSIQESAQDVTTGPWQPRRKPKRPVALARATKEWWDAPETLDKSDYLPTKPQFAFDVPEHLPNSPMCPAHPRNKTRGLSVCVVSQFAHSTPPGPWISG
jgi:hypothetical protein